MAFTYKTKQIFCLVYCCVLFISGVILICTTTILSYKMFVHSKFVPINNLGPLIILLILGFLHLFLTWIGVKGSTREHLFYVVAVIISSVAVIVGLLITLTWTVMLYVNVTGEVESIMKTSFADYLKYGNDTKDWSIIETKYNCCGIEGPDDYNYGNCTRSNKGCKEPFAYDIRNLHIKLLIIGSLVFIQSVIGCVLYTLFNKALREEQERRRELKRQRMLRARMRRMTQT